jgi:uncharacterized protein YgfB (UPF0149 family)
MQDTYAELDRSLGAMASGVEASEAHGCLCGALCAENAFPATEWAAEVLPDDAGEAAAAALVGLLSDIRDETLRSLAGEDLDFRPLLPDDDRPLDERVRALAAWCAGYLYGLGRSGLLDKLPGDLGEILQDFSEISRATLAAGESGESGEEAERDYTELVEFVRASVQLAYEELAPQRSRHSAAPGHEH